MESDSDNLLILACKHARGDIQEQEVSEIKLGKHGASPAWAKAKPPSQHKFHSSGNHVRAESDNVPEPAMTLKSYSSCPSPNLLPTAQPGSLTCPGLASPHLPQTPTHCLLRAVGTSST